MKYDQAELIQAYRDVFVLSESGQLILYDLLRQFEFMSVEGTSDPLVALAYVNRKAVLDYILEQITSGELIPAVEIVQNVSKAMAEQSTT